MLPGGLSVEDQIADNIKKTGSIGMHACVYTENFQCAQCGKFGYKNTTWIYKRNAWINKKERTVYFCSYSCTRAWDKEHEKIKGGAK